MRNLKIDKALAMLVKSLSPSPKFSQSGAMFKQFFTKFPLPLRMISFDSL